MGLTAELKIRMMQIWILTLLLQLHDLGQVIPFSEPRCLIYNMRRIWIYSCSCPTGGSSYCFFPLLLQQCLKYGRYYILLLLLRFFVLLWKRYMCYIGRIRKVFPHRAKCNRSAQTLNNFFHTRQTLAGHWRARFSLDDLHVATEHRPVLIFRMSHYRAIRSASSFGSDNLPMETSASSSLEPASYAMERKTGLLTCTEMQPWFRAARS